MAVLKRAAALVAVLCSLVTCGGVFPARTAERGLSLQESDVDAIIDRVVRVRQIKLTKPVTVKRLTAAKLVDKLRASRSKTAAKDGTPVDLAFNLVGPGKEAGAAEIEEELVLGIYHIDEHAIYYRDTSGADREDLRKQRLVIAHEVHHALQFTEFGKPEPPKSLDGALALEALFEGDAQVTMALFLGSEYGIPLRRTLRTVFEINDRIQAEEVARGDQLSHGSAVTKRLILFPYDEGMHFVADVFRAGGLELVNKMYATPPKSTEQILHPNKYLAGELPTPVATPKAPDGFEIVEHDTLGEFGMSQVLERCIGEKKARKAARGWAGDHYAVAVSKEQRVALLWSTVWDDEKSAKRFAEAAEKDPACWTKRKAGNYRISAGLRVVRDGLNVAIVSGIPKNRSEDIGLGLVTLVGTAPTPVEVSSARVPKTEKIPKAKRGRLKKRRYTSKWLGIEAKVPKDIRGSVSEDIELTLRKSGDAFAGLFVSDRVHTKAYNEATFDYIQRAASEGAGLDNLELKVLSDHVATTPLGPGVARLWGTGNTAFRMRVILVPVCHGTGSYVFVQAYDNNKAHNQLDDWLESFEWLSSDPPPICKKLNPR